jgi:hypothetical protein
MLSTHAAVADRLLDPGLPQVAQRERSSERSTAELDNAFQCAQHCRAGQHDPVRAALQSWTARAGRRRQERRALQEHLKRQESGGKGSSGQCRRGGQGRPIVSAGEGRTWLSRVAVRRDSPSRERHPRRMAPRVHCPCFSARCSSAKGRHLPRASVRTRTLPGSTSASHGRTLQHTAALCSTRQHLCGTRQYSTAHAFWKHVCRLCRLACVHLCAV